MKIYQKWSLSVILLTCTLLVFLTGINYIVDPLQFYHKAFYQPVFSEQQRYQNPGLAKNYDYDTIIVGSSMSENHLPSYVNDKLGVKTMKLSIMGSSAKEQYLIAKLALETGKVKNVIWPVDYFSMRGDPTRVREEYGAFPFYLYDQNPLNDLNYLVNIGTIKQALNVASVNFGFAQSLTSDLNTLNTWHDPKVFNRQIVLKAWEKLKQGGSVSIEEYETEALLKNLDMNVLSLVKKYPGVKFYLYYPPYSILQHRYYYEKNPVLFENELLMKRHLFNKVGTSPNVNIYDFQQEKILTFDLNNYKDLAHYSRKTNEWIIDQFKNEKYRVTKQTLEGFLTDLKNQVESLNISKL